MEIPAKFRRNSGEIPAKFRPWHLPLVSSQPDSGDAGLRRANSGYWTSDNLAAGRVPLYRNG
jgi:hypothetical protein